MTATTAQSQPSFGFTVGQTSALVPDESKVDATVEGSVKVLAAGVGYTWGHALVTYSGKQYKIDIEGLSVIDAGVATVKASGDIYNLKHLSDLEGIYVSASTGLAIAEGGGIAYLRNRRGVVVKLHATEVGLRFNLSPSGVRVRLVGPK